MTYQELKNLTDGKQLPIAGKNEDGENVIVSHGKIGDRKYYKLTTAQSNGWTRYNYVYEDGDTEESYAKG